MTRPRRPSPLGRPGLRATPPLPQLVCLAVALLGQPAASARAPRRAHGVLRASSQAGAAHVLSQHGVIRRGGADARSEDSVTAVIAELNERILEAWVSLDQLRAERSITEEQSELRRRQLAADIARLSDQSSRQEGERAAAAAGLQEVDEHFAELRRRRESQVAERVARRLADEKLLLALENDTNVAMGLVNYTRCSESAASAALLSSQTRTRRARTSPRRSPRGAAVLPAHAHTAHFPAAPSRLCRSAGSRLYLHGDHRVQAWLQHVTALPRAQHLFHQVLGSLASRASFVKTSRAHRDDEYTYVVGPMVSDAAEDTCDTSLVMSEENMETKCTKRAASMGCSVIIDPGCTGDDNWRMCYYQTIDDLIALGDSYTSTNTTNTTNSTNSTANLTVCTRVQYSTVWPTDNLHDMCTIGELHCGHVHASAVVLLGELKDSADEIRDRMATDAEHAREANEEIDLQLQLLHQSKGELSSQLAEATSRLNAVEEQVAHAAAEAQALQLEAGRRRSEHERREHDLLSSQVCSMRQLRSATVAESTTVVEDDIVDCEVSDWEPGECSLECDDSCPAWGSDAKPCGGERTMTRQVIQEASEYGVQCPPLQQVIPCSQVRCPVDCQMSEWSGWSSCTRHCNGGVRQRTRSVLQEPKNGGEACDAVEETQPCGTGACAAACELAEWTEWSACSAACGTGYQQRFQFPRAPHQCPADKSEGHQEAQECTEATCQGDEACIAKQDIVVAVDSSGSLTAEEFANVTSFTSALLGKFNGTAYGQNASRIGVVQFGNGEIYGVDQTPTDAIKVLDFSTDNNTILAAVYGLQQQSGFANSAQAMALAETMLDEGAGDSGRNRMLLMVAASTPPFQRQSQLKARELSRKGIRVFFVTVADSSRGAEARAAKEMATAPTLANFVHVAWHDMATEQSAYVSSALAASCSLAESPTLVAEENEENGFELLRQGQACSTGPTLLDRYATDPAHCAQLAYAAGATYFSYGTGPHDGRCYSENADDDSCGGAFYAAYSDFYKLSATYTTDENATSEG